MSLLCILVSIPDFILYIPLTFFLLEYKKKKDSYSAALHKRNENQTQNHETPPGIGLGKLLFASLLQAILNPVVWAIVFGIVCNFLFDSYWTFFSKTVEYLAQTAYAVCMFNMGLFLFVLCASVTLKFTPIFSQSNV